MSALEPAEPPRHYQRDRPGELIHIDIKRLGKFNKIGHRITGDRTGQSENCGVDWEFVHVCIDAASRIAFSRVMKTERKGCAITFLNHPHQALYPNTNGKAERFIQTALREWDYAKPITLHVSAPPSCLTGCIDTTGTALMAVSEPCRPSANSA